VVLKIVNPSDGDAMASLCAMLRRGGKKPLSVALRSNSAEASGVVVPIPTWAFTWLKPMKASRRKSLPQPHEVSGQALPRRGVFTVEFNFVFIVLIVYSLKFLVSGFWFEVLSFNI
jgi:hypothetical protein